MQAAPERGAETAYSWWVAIVTLVMASLGFGAVTAVPILMKPIAAEWGRSAAELASVHGAAMAGAGVAGLLIGRLHDRFGFFPLAVAAALATGGGLLMASSASGLPQLYVAFGLLVGACGQGVLFSGISAAVSQWFDRHRAFAISIAACGQSLGGLVLPPAMRWSAAAFGWRETLFAFGLLSGVLLLAGSLVFRRAPPAQAAPTRAAGGAHKGAYPRTRILPLGVCLGLFNLATFIVIGHLTAAAEESGTGPVAAAALVSVLLGASLLSRLAWPLLGSRVGPMAALRAASLVHVAGLGALAACHGNYMGMAVSATLVGIGFGAYLPGYAVLVREMCGPQEAGRRIAEIYFFGFAAAAVGSWGGGLLRDAAGNYAFTIWGAVLAALMGLFALRRLACASIRC